MFLDLPDPHPDPLVKGTDPRIRIRTRIRTKMSRISNTAYSYCIIQFWSPFPKPRRKIRKICFSEQIGSNFVNQHLLSRNFALLTCAERRVLLLSARLVLQFRSQNFTGRTYEQMKMVEPSSGFRGDDSTLDTAAQRTELELQWWNPAAGSGATTARSTLPPSGQNWN